MRRSRTIAVPPAPDQSSPSPGSRQFWLTLTVESRAANPGHAQSDRGPAARMPPAIQEATHERN